MDALLLDWQNRLSVWLGVNGECMLSCFVRAVPRFCQVGHSYFMVFFVYPSASVGNAVLKCSLFFMLLEAM
jgi:hypothetical protein